MGDGASPAQDAGMQRWHLLVKPLRPGMLPWTADGHGAQRGGDVVRDGSAHCGLPKRVLGSEAAQSSA